MKINLCNAQFLPEIKQVLASKIAGKKLAIIAGVRGFAAVASELGAQFGDADAASAEAARNTAKPLNISGFCVYFTSLAERAQSQAIAADIRARAGCELVLAIGGGVACDVGKLTAFMLGVPVLCVPTIAATCACTSSLSVLYKGHEFAEFAEFSSDLVLEMLAPLKVLRAAPKRYLLAGIGDTMAKFYESRLQMSASASALDFANILGKTLAPLCAQLLLDADLERDFEAVCGAILLNTGLVSRLIRPEFNGALAHAACYALVAQNSLALHGELVAFGLLVQLAVLGDAAEFARVKAALERTGLPVHLRDLLPGGFDAQRFAADVLAASDVKNLLECGVDLSRIYEVANELESW